MSPALTGLVGVAAVVFLIYVLWRWAHRDDGGNYDDGYEYYEEEHWEEEYWEER